jgi:hypothetical protein
MFGDDRRQYPLWIIDEIPQVVDMRSDLLSIPSYGPLYRGRSLSLLPTGGVKST